MAAPAGLTILGLAFSSRPRSVEFDRRRMEAVHSRRCGTGRFAVVLLPIEFKDSTLIPSVPGSLWSAKLPRLGGPEMFFAFVVSPRWIRPVALDEEESLSRSSSLMFPPPVGAGVFIFQGLIIATPGLIGPSGVARRGSGGVLRHYHRFCSAWAGEKTGSAGVDSR